MGEMSYVDISNWINRSNPFIGKQTRQGVSPERDYASSRSVFYTFVFPNRHRIVRFF
jgi:hypothetical protein